MNLTEFWGHMNVGCLLWWVACLTHSEDALLFIKSIVYMFCLCLYPILVFTSTFCNVCTWNCLYYWFCIWKWDVEHFSMAKKNDRFDFLTMKFWSIVYLKYLCIMNLIIVSIFIFILITDLDFLQNKKHNNFPHLSVHVSSLLKLP